MQKIQHTENIREYLDKFFDTADKLVTMEVEINKDILNILILQSLPTS